MNGYERFVPWFGVGLAALYLAIAMAPVDDVAGQMQLQKFGEIPVVANGRVKPMDSLARNTMMVISNRQTFQDEAKKDQPAIKWLLDVMTRQLSDKQVADKYKVFRIENDQVLNMLGLEERPLFWRYSINELSSKMEDIQQRADRATKQDPKQRDLFDTKTIELAQHLQLFIELAQWMAPLAIPPASGINGEDWKTFREALRDLRESGQESPDARALGSVLLAYAEGKPDVFNRELANYHQRLTDRMPEEMSKARFETFFNHFAPFYQCSILYVLVVMLTCVGWIVYTDVLNRTAFWLALLTLAVHTWALIARMYIQGRPPVTNLYSASIFIGWGCVILGLVLESIYRNGVGNVVAGATGSLTLVLAHNLASGGDTLEMMQAVLDTNFWLATHVTCVTTGYAATYVAGFLGILLIIRGVFTRSLNTEAYRTLGSMIYGITCFAMFFSFTGTVLGGIWADQSWGRFWGWDPKENGALIIVIWNALLLHARWGGIIQQRGMALVAVAGNIVTTWSFFGTNMLGVGLHSYGFMSGALFWLVLFIATQLTIIGLGSLPLQKWRSFASPTQDPPRSPAEPKARRREVPAVGASS